MASSRDVMVANVSINDTSTTATPSMAIPDIAHHNHTNGTNGTHDNGNGNGTNMLTMNRLPAPHSSKRKQPSITSMDQMTRMQRKSGGSHGSMSLSTKSIAAMTHNDTKEISSKIESVHATLTSLEKLDNSRRPAELVQLFLGGETELQEPQRKRMILRVEQFRAALEDHELSNHFESQHIDPDVAASPKVIGHTGPVPKARVSAFEIDPLPSSSTASSSSSSVSTVSPSSVSSLSSSSSNDDSPISMNESPMAVSSVTRGSGHIVSAFPSDDQPHRPSPRHFIPAPESFIFTTGLATVPVPTNNTSNGNNNNGNGNSSSVSSNGSTPWSTPSNQTPVGSRPASPNHNHTHNHINHRERSPPPPPAPPAPSHRHQSAFAADHGSPPPQPRSFAGTGTLFLAGGVGDHHRSSPQPLPSLSSSSSTSSSAGFAVPQLPARFNNKNDHHNHNSGHGHGHVPNGNSNSGNNGTSVGQIYSFPPTPLSLSITSSPETHYTHLNASQLMPPPSMITRGGMHELPPLPLASPSLGTPQVSNSGFLPSLPPLLMSFNSTPSSPPMNTHQLNSPSMVMSSTSPVLTLSISGSQPPTPSHALYHNYSNPSTPMPGGHTGGMLRLMMSPHPTHAAAPLAPPPPTAAGQFAALPPVSQFDELSSLGF